AAGLKDAQDQTYQQLLNSLTTAYTINAVIQFPAAISSPYPDAAEPTAPNLFGVPVTSEAGSVGNTSQVAPYTLSTAKVALNGSTSSFLTFMFNVSMPGSQ